MYVVLTQLSPVLIVSVHFAVNIKRKICVESTVYFMDKIKFCRSTFFSLSCLGLLIYVRCFIFLFFLFIWLYYIKIDLKNEFKQKTLVEIAFLAIEKEKADLVEMICWFGLFCMRNLINELMFDYFSVSLNTSRRRTAFSSLFFSCLSLSLFFFSPSSSYILIQFLL